VSRAPVPSALDPEVRRSALGLSVTEGMFGAAHMAMTGNGVGGNVFTFGFALLLGATDAHLAVLAALPRFATAMQLVAARVFPRVGSRRRLVVMATAAYRVLFFVVPLLPWMFGRRLSLVAFLVVWAVACLAAQFAANGWLSWMSDLVPSSRRGRYFSHRTNVTNLVGLAAGTLAAVLLDAYAGAPGGFSAEADERRLVGFVVIFAAAAALGTISVALMMRQADVPRDAQATPDSSRTSLLEFVAAPLRHAPFRRLLLFCALAAFAAGLGGPFWIPYAIENAAISYSTITLLGLGSGVIGLVTMRFWGGLVDRSSRAALGLLLALLALQPLLYLASGPAFLAPIAVDLLLSAMLVAAWYTASLACLLERSPSEQGRGAYFAVFALVEGLAGAAGSLAGGVLVSAAPDGRRFVFAMVCLLRLGTLATLPLLLGRRPLTSGPTRSAGRTRNRRRVANTSNTRGGPARPGTGRAPRLAATAAAADGLGAMQRETDLKAQCPRRG
jgi:MFS family permease